MNNDLKYVTELTTEAMNERGMDIDYENSRRVIRAFREVHELKPKKRKRKDVVPFTRTEMDALYEAAREHSFERYLIIRALYESGARIGAFSRIKVADCHFEQGMIQLRRTKNGKERMVPITKELAGLLKEHTDRHGKPALFVSQRGTGYSSRRLQMIVTETGEAAGITSGCHAHKFRKTRASFLINHGWGIAEVQEFLGHDDPSTTAQHYAKVSVDRMARMVEEAEEQARQPMRLAS